MSSGAFFVAFQPKIATLGLGSDCFLLYRVPEALILALCACLFALIAITQPRQLSQYQQRERRAHIAMGLWLLQA